MGTGTSTSARPGSKCGTRTPTGASARCANIAHGGACSCTTRRTQRWKWGRRMCSRARSTGPWTRRAPSAARTSSSGRVATWTCSWRAAWRNAGRSCARRQTASRKPRTATWWRMSRSPCPRGVVSSCTTTSSTELDSACRTRSARATCSSSSSCGPRSRPPRRPRPGRRSRPRSWTPRSWGRGNRWTTWWRASKRGCAATRGSSPGTRRRRSPRPRRSMSSCRRLAARLSALALRTVLVAAPIGVAC
mmetsp:Transcript_87799/g.226323  ORF Transcript_87799/g.226323 Transcript_87799/m.226323 type:complete len:248 (-) Transcript_87799:617-1360(-)